MFCKCEEKKHIFQYLEHQLDLVSCYYFNLMNKLYTVVAFYILKLTAYNNNINLSLGFIIKSLCSSKELHYCHFQYFLCYVWHPVKSVILNKSGHHYTACIMSTYLKQY